MRGLCCGVERLKQRHNVCNYYAEVKIIIDGVELKERKERLEEEVK